MRRLRRTGVATALLGDAEMYDIFISYSHGADKQLSRDLERALNRVAKPWYRPRVLRVFRDATDLTAATSLHEGIRSALGRSRYFLLLASPESAASRWVGEEIEIWRTQRGPDTFLIAVTDGEVVWQDREFDFDWTRTTALPRALTGYFRLEPIWENLHFARATGNRGRGRNRASLADDEFRSAVASLASGPRGVGKKQLDDFEARQHRSATRLRAAAVTALILLTVVSLIAGFVARNQAEIAGRRARESDSRALAAQAISALTTNPRLSTHLALYAYRVDPTPEARSALATVVQATAHFRGFLGPRSDRAVLHRSATNYPADDVAISGDGRRIAAYSEFDVADDAPADAISDQIRVYEADTLREIARVPGASDGPLSLDFYGDRLLSGSQVWDVGSGKSLMRFNAGGWWPKSALSANGQWVVATERTPGGGLVRVIDVASGAEVGRHTTASPTPGVRFAVDESSLHVVDAEAGASAYRRLDLVSRAWDTDLPIPDMPTGFAYPDDTGTTAVVLTPGNDATGVVAELQTWNLREGKIRGVPAGAVTGANVATTPDNRFVSITTRDGALTLYDSASASEVTWSNPHAPLVVTRAALSADGARLVTVGEDGAIVLHTRVEGGHREDLDTAAGVVSADGRIGLTRTGPRTVVRDLVTGAERGRMPEGMFAGPATNAAIDATRDFARIATSIEGRVLVWDGVAAQTTYDKRVAAPSNSGFRTTATIGFLADEHFLLVYPGTGKKATVIDTRVNSFARTLDVGGDGDNVQLSLGPDRRTLAVLDFGKVKGDRTGSATITFWNWDDAKDWFDRGAHVTVSGDFAVNYLLTDLLGFALSADRTTASIRDSAGRVHLVDLRGDGKVVKVLEDSWSSSADGPAVFNSGGDIVAVSTGQGDHRALTLWDTGTGEVLARWPLGTGDAGQIASGADGTFFTAGRSHSNSGITRWSVDVESWYRILCAKIRVDHLTDAERRRYLHGIEIGALCAQ